MDASAARDGPDLGLLDLIELPILQHLQDTFAIATGVASIITLPDGQPLTEPSNFSRLCRDVIRKTDQGLKNCMNSDANLGRPNPTGPTMSPCLSCGLWDGGASIFAGERHVANWLIGQVRNEQLSEARILAYAREIGADERAFQEAFLEVTEMSTARFRAVCDFLFSMANQLSSLAYQRIMLRREEAARARLEQQLLQTRKLQAIGQLAGGVAHDFNNLLTTILGNTDLLLMDLEPGRMVENSALEQLTEVRGAGLRASALTRQLLAFSRQQVGSPSLLDLNEVVRQFVPMLRSLIPESINLRTSFDLEPATFVADRSQVEQVIMNLALNARDAMPRGGELSIEVGSIMLDREYTEMVPEAREGPHVRLEVRDHGEGMPAEVLERIFEPFFTTKPQGKGTGMGLATVYGLIHQADGHVAVHSVPGHGSVFRIHWPRVEGTPQTLDRCDEPAEQCRGTETLMVCEDSKQVRELTVRFLRGAGYRVVEASTGDEALAMLDALEQPPELLLTDVIMPGLNGRELADRVRHRLPGIRILFMSGYTADVIGRHGVLEPGVKLIEKPFNHATLLRAVRRALDEIATPEQET
ncbi:MAG: PocR ligand-binding domain-containing protein [Deltaproteobacteria bacterium]|nr:PocR ligand-binding domain-containing protein [Deltaproteobacteria bacterium]